MTEQNEHFFEVKEGKGFTVVIDDHDQKTLKVGEALTTDAILGKGTCGGQLTHPLLIFTAKAV